MRNMLWVGGLWGDFKWDQLVYIDSILILRIQRGTQPLELPLFLGRIVPPQSRLFMDDHYANSAPQIEEEDGNGELSSPTLLNHTLTIQLTCGSTIL